VHIVASFPWLTNLLKRLKQCGDCILSLTQMSRILGILEDLMVMQGISTVILMVIHIFDDLKNCIAAFNRPGSQKLCFLLYTHTGGLGMNL